MSTILKAPKSRKVSSDCWPTNLVIGLGPAAEPLDPTEPLAPRATDASWWAGYTAAKAEMEDALRELELAIARLTEDRDSLRAELSSLVF